MYFELYRDAKGEYRWRLKSRNHQIIAVSSESYTTKQNCEHSIELVQETTKETEVKDLTKA